MLGKYYAAKIRGATELALFRETRDAAHQKKAVEHLRARAAALVARTRSAPAAQYRNPLWTNRVGLVDWRELSDEVANDIAIASAAAQGALSALQQLGIGVAQLRALRQDFSVARRAPR